MILPNSMSSRPVPKNTGRRTGLRPPQRAQEPVEQMIWPGNVPVFVITGFAEAKSALADPRLFKDLRKLAPDHDFLRLRPPESLYSEGRQVLGSDDTEHVKLRRTMRPHFSVEAVERKRPFVEQMVADLVDALDDRTEVDLVADFAYPLTTGTICTIVGVPERDRRQILNAVELVTCGADPTLPFMVAAGEQLRKLLATMLADKREAPGDDYASWLIHQYDNGTIDGAEMISMVGTPLVAGFESTRNLITSGAQLLLAHPCAADLIRTDSTAVTRVIEELARIAAPFSFMSWRFAAEALDIGGVRIPAGAIILVDTHATGHDPAIWPHPGSVDPDQLPNNPHLSFGYGRHHCAGAPLARLEATIALPALFQRFPHLRLACPAEDLPWHGLALWGVDRLPVRLDSARPSP